MSDTPQVLTIAGSDSSGGAGIQADLKTFEALGVYGTTVITCVTAQNTHHFASSVDLPPEVVQAQLESVIDDFQISAVKTGMLSSAEIISTVAEFLERSKLNNIVIDPVMISKTGFQLLRVDALQALKTKLLPLGFLVTPNIEEAEILSKIDITSQTEMRKAAETIHDLGVRYVLVKGGDASFSEACDLLYDGITFRFIEGEFISGKKPHGTGCTYSAAITAQLARGEKLVEAIRNAKRYVEETIRRSSKMGKGNEILHHTVSLS